MWFEALLEEVICEVAGLRQAVHSFVDGDMDPALGVGKGVKIVLLDDFVGNERDVYLHVLRSIQRCV